MNRRGRGAVSAERAAAASEETGASDAAAMVTAVTRLCSPPLVPELKLWLGDDVTEIWLRTEAASSAELPPPFWAFAWAGGQAVARYLLDHREVVAGRSVLDVAAGGGVVAVAALRAGAAAVTATDLDPLAIAAIKLNAEANGVSVDARLADVLDGDGEGADVLLAGDVWYSRAMAARMIGLVERAAARGATVLVGDAGRAYLPRERLEAVAEYDISVTRDLESVEMKRATVLRPMPQGERGDAGSQNDHR